MSLILSESNEKLGNFFKYFKVFENFIEYQGKLDLKMVDYVL